MPTFCVAPDERDIGKRCGPRSDAAERGVWSGSTLFALITDISIKHGNNKIDQTPLKPEMKWSKELRKKSPLGING